MVAWAIGSLGLTWVVLTELDASSCVSLRRQVEVFVFLVAHAACTWKSRAFSSTTLYLAVLSRRLGVACGVWNIGFFGR